jgi:hypothetical protein
MGSIQVQLPVKKQEDAFLLIEAPKNDILGRKMRHRSIHNVSSIKSVKNHGLFVEYHMKYNCMYGVS